MKAEINQKNVFQPFDLTVRVETESECIALRNLFTTEDNICKQQFDLIASLLDQKLEHQEEY